MPIIGQRAPLPVIEATQDPAPVAPQLEGQPEATIPAPQDEQLSPKFAALARQEKELRRRQQALKAQEEALKVERSKYETDYISKSKLTENPIELLMSQGMTQEQIAQMLLNPPNAQDMAVKQLKAEIEALKKNRDEDKTSERQQALAQIKRDLTALVSSSDQFECIKAYDAHDSVVQEIESAFDKDGTLLSLEEAAQKVEDNLLEIAVKAASLKKVQSKLTPPTPAPQDQEALIESAVAAQALKRKQPLSQRIAPKETQTPLKTLNNVQTAPTTKRLSARDRAILAFKGELQN